MAQVIQLRRGTAAEATAANPILAQGEMGVETDTGKFKIGNGVTPWNSLAYAAGTTAAGSAFTPASGLVSTNVQAAIVEALSRSKHTGTQLAATISDFAEAVDDRVATLLVAGTGIQIVYDDNLGTITLTGTQGSDEQIDDRVAALLQAGQSISLSYNDATGQLTVSGKQEKLVFALSDETSSLTTGVKISMAMPAGFTVLASNLPRMTLNNQSTAGSVVGDIKKNGTSILGATKLTVDVNQKTSVTSGSQTSVVTTAFADGDILSIELTSVGAGAKGAKVVIYGTWAT